MSCGLIKLANPNIQALNPYEPGKPICELERELGIANIIKLASNENPLGPSPKVLAIMQAVLSQLTRYPDSGGYRLKQKLAENLGVNEEQITLGNGSNDILDLIARAYLNERTHAIYSQHAFIVYDIAVKACNAQASVTPAKNWGHDLEAMKKAVNETTRIIFIANPNNPTGTWVSLQEVEQLLSGIPDHVLVILDEAYFEYMDDKGYGNSLALLQEFPNLVICRTFSKAYGLAALRLGYCISHVEVANILNRIRQPFNVGTLAMEAAIEALNDVEYLVKSRTVNHQGMEQLVAVCDDLGLEYIPSAGNFLTIHLRQPSLPVYQKLLHEGVIVRPISVYGMPEHIRVSIGLEQELEYFARALKKVL